MFFCLFTSRRAGELDADKLGMEVIMAAGYDPHQVCAGTLRS